MTEQTTKRDVAETFTNAIKALTANPDRAAITNERLFENGHHLKVMVDRADIGKIIGAGGEHIKALQILFLKVGRALDVPIKITVLEPVEGERKEQLPFINNPGADVSDIVALAIDLLTIAGYGDIDLHVSTDNAQTTFLIRKTRAMDGTREWDAFKTSLSKIITAAGRLRGRVILIDYVST